MGKLVKAMAAEAGFDTAPPVHRGNNESGSALTKTKLEHIDVAIDFSTREAVEANLPRLAEAGVNVVIGTTGWQASHERLRALCLDAGIGVVAAPNFSVGVQYFLEIVRSAAAMAAAEHEMGAYIHEEHHARKTDKPSGTALEMAAQMVRAGYERTIDISSTRAGHVPGTHTLGLDSPTETITLTHRTRSRRTFASGALVAARWVLNRQGWFSMADVLGLDVDPAAPRRR
ncbi:MAG: dihydrodipicolinate reductase [Acidobacteria bacterium]|nr:dihydrodipicolinate reductase [Acidobacteriota bacterium]